jgi:hypothetical protein
LNSEKDETISVPITDIPEDNTDNTDNLNINSGNINGMDINILKISGNIIENGSIIESPNPEECEKNWIPVNDSIIYKWFIISPINIINRPSIMN